MIMVRTGDNPLFETAYFVLRDDIERGGNDLVAEANRLVAEAIAERKSANQKNKRKLVSFLCGLLCGVIASSIFIFLIRLV